MQIAAKIHPGGPGGNGGGGMGAMGGGGMGGGGVMGGGGMGSGSSVGSKRSIDSDGSGNFSDHNYIHAVWHSIDMIPHFFSFSCRTRMQEDEQRLRLSITKFQYATSDASCPTSMQIITRPNRLTQ